jgi:hypothetical protein
MGWAEQYFGIGVLIILGGIMLWGMVALQAALMAGAWADRHAAETLQEDWEDAQDDLDDATERGQA